METMTDSLVIIPSAKLVPIELQAEFGPIPPAMIPLDGRPSLHYITEQHPGSSFLVATHEAAEDVSACVAHHIEAANINVVDVGNTRSLGETILKALDSREKLPKHLIIHFADTAIPSLTTIGDCLYYAVTDEVYRWTTFNSDDSGKIISINEKETNKACTNTKVFVGIFSITNVGIFRENIEKCLMHPDEIDSFYHALQQYSDLYPIKLCPTEDWLDFGHLDTYYESRKKLSSACREFNTISVDFQRGRIVKTSRNTKKLIDEIRWYLKLPKELQHIAPRVFTYDLDANKPRIEMEFYGYPVLNDLYLYGHLDLGTWSRIFKSITQAFQDLAGWQLPSSSLDELHRSRREIFETKTLERIEIYRNCPEFAWAVKGDVIVNGRNVMPLDDIVVSLPEVLKKAGIYGEADFSIIHGDPCFSNILYDPRNSIIRMIDPRGSFGAHDIYGDPRYDWCKLNHSIEGDYDFLVNGLFHFERNGKHVILEPNLSKRHEGIKQVYLERLLQHFDEVEHSRIRLLESLLFLSMIPLHSDRPRSQQAFLARGLSLFSEYRQLST
jgi:hypothetical protein